MNIPQRYTLATFMLLVTVVAILFGYVNWRTQSMLSAADRFNRANSTVIELTDSWLRPVPESDSMVIAFTKSANGQIGIQGQQLSVEEAKAHYADFATCLRSIGVSEVSPEIIRKKTENGANFLVIETSRGIEE